MKTILVLGAGKSATCMIDYLLECSNSKSFRLVVADGNKDLVESKTKGHPNATPIVIDANDEIERRHLIAQSDIVISMLPPHMHPLIARDCLKYSKHLLSASYVSPFIREMESEILEKNLIFLFEMGLDPGIDHMSAMHLIERIKSKGGRVISFKSHCGGLVAPESDDNVWHYKISWNSRNIVQAGMAGAEYLEDGQKISVPYHQLFNSEQQIEVPGLGRLSWYANRDSLSYIPLYQLENIETFIRTTLRYPDFNFGWNIVVQLKLTAEEKWIENPTSCAYDFFLKHLRHYQLEEKFQTFTGFSITEIEQTLIDKNQVPPHLQNRAISLLLGLGVFDKEIILRPTCESSFDALLQLAETKWALQKDDHDMIVMLHEIEYLDQNTKKQYLKSSLVIKGIDPVRTAMAYTVGLPLGIAAKLIIEEKIKSKGLQIPISSEIYTPVLIELEENGIVFLEE